MNYNIYKYKNHTDYVNHQIEKWKANVNGKWVDDADIKYLYDNFLYKHFDKIQFGICHGAKTGYENKLFSQYTGANFIGTDLSVTKNCDNVIQWDFHELKDEWINNVDVIYTNALDHTYKPVECLSTWIKCLTTNGVIIIEWTKYHGTDYDASRSDPLSADKEQYWKFIEEAGGIKIEELSCVTSNAFRKDILKYFLIFGKRKT